jgi:hypothetical protein
MAAPALAGMGAVLSFTDARAERVKAKLCALASSRSPGMVETAHGLIDARRIFCREAIAVLIDRYGCQTRVGYGDITDVSPQMSAADIIRLANWQVVEAEEPPPETVTVVPFPIERAARRRSGHPD